MRALRPLQCRCGDVVWQSFFGSTNCCVALQGCTVKCCRLPRGGGILKGTCAPPPLP